MMTKVSTVLKLLSIYLIFITNNLLVHVYIQLYLVDVMYIL